ncbi:MAG: class I SAM-dependent methyltransferase [Verrucomicrobia bacterium]|nr:class I SAM-dependent methyltransferase [Verrucomicrobiota bacterium]MBS0645538.1 class I SAM-dependent methyltransferase [Verrucomicrobiota bacterium]
MTSWDKVSDWYDALVGTEGHYYHQHIIFPRLLPMLELCAGSSLLDLGCGQGILASVLPKNISYHGIDLSPSLVAKAPKGACRQYSVADVCEPLPISPQSFTHATMILCLQNMEHPQKALSHTAAALKEGGSFVCVLNHPCFRIPRQTHWQVDPQQKLQYRRINRYLSTLKIPIEMHPGQQSKKTYSFHHSLSDYSKFLYEAGFVIELIEEWASDKKSTGRAAKMENFARQEFPLFLTFKCRKRT